jgi:subfamily B ATP-binding cassette protein MsbA
VIESGNIVERGTHEELLAAAGRYYDLYTKQHGLEMNLFLAPGEGDAVPESQKAGAARGAGAGLNVSSVLSGRVPS